MESLESDKDLVAKIEDELRMVNEAVELGNTPSREIWKHREKIQLPRSGEPFVEFKLKSTN